MKFGHIKKKKRKELKINIKYFNQKEKRENNKTQILYNTNKNINGIFVIKNSAIMFSYKILLFYHRMRRLYSISFVQKRNHK